MFRTRSAVKVICTGTAMNKPVCWIGGLLWIAILCNCAFAEEYDTDSNITSPNYPKPFGPRETRYYNIHNRNHDTEDYLALYFETFDIVADPLNPDAVSLRIEDHHGREIGLYTTAAPPGLLTKFYKFGPTLKIRFQSNVKVAVNVTGFKIYFKRFNATTIVGPKLLENHSNGVVHSPGYPLNYPMDSVFMYRISTPLQDGVVQFQFTDIDLGDDAVIGIYDAETDGTPYLIYQFFHQEGKHWRYYLSGNVMTLVLKTGKRPTARGFNLTFTEYCRIAGEELPCSLLPHSAMTNVIIFVVSITGIIGFILLLVGCSVFFRR